MIKKISIIGVGKMGGAIAKKLSETIGKKQLFLCDRSRDPDEAVRFGDLIILAVKPQSFDELAAKISAPFGEKIVLSIMAGVRVKKIMEKLKAKKVVRAMPNLPLQVGAGFTSWTASPAVDPKTKKEIRKWLGLFGREAEVKKESMMDGLIAISGCGPAWFFYLTELLTEKAMAFGLSETNARAMAEQTLIGSAALLQQGGHDAKTWRKAVTSKGGVTEAGLKYLEKKNWNKIFSEALDAAKKRSEEL